MVHHISQGKGNKLVKLMPPWTEVLVPLLLKDMVHLDFPADSWNVIVIREVLRGHDISRGEHFSAHGAGTLGSEMD